MQDTLISQSDETAVQEASYIMPPSTAKDTQSRKYLITINNPREKGITSESIESIITGHFSTCVYYCLADEIGGKEKTHHTHIFISFSSAVRFSQIKKYFPTAHIDRCRGTAAENRDYVFKVGKHEDTDKGATNLPETRKEWGELPNEPGRGSRADLAAIYDRIRSGINTQEIIEEFPAQVLNMARVEQARQRFLFSEMRSKLRNLFVVYIHGSTGTGKTRSIYEIHSTEDLYRTTDFKNPFDHYECEDILVLDEFQSSINMEQMLNILDIYPASLPARYANKQAAYSRVYIISNIPLTAQYPYQMESNPETWNAFRRRIHCVIDFDKIARNFKTYRERTEELKRIIDETKSRSGFQAMDEEQLNFDCNEIFGV